MSFEEKCLDFIPAMEASSQMKYVRLNGRDLDLCDYVSSKIPVIELPTIEIRDEISEVELIEKSCDTLAIFGSEFISRAKSILSSALFEHCKNAPMKFSVIVDYSIDKKKISPYGKVSCVHSYRNVYSNDIYTFGHECCHALKDTQFEEQRNSFVTGEVVPLFYELVYGNGDSIDSVNLLRARMWYLLNNSQEYMKCWELFNKDYDINKINLYRYLYSSIGNYLGSFYYAVILYNMYKSNPKKVCDKISQVLRRDKTTLDILKELDIYGYVQGEVFESEIKKLVKIIE